MSAQNPEAGIEALAGKVYTLKGQKVHNTMLAMIALESAGIGVADLVNKSRSASAIMAYALLHPASEVLEAIGNRDVEKKAFEFVADWTPEELGEALAIENECALRFSASFTSYSNPKAKGKNSPAE